MDIFVLDQNFQLIDICDTYESVIWTPRYFDIGDFEIYLPATPENISLLTKDRYVVRDKDVFENGFKNVMIIEKIRISTSIENGNYLTVTGRCLKSILKRRIVWQQTILNGTVENGIRKIVNENAINPIITQRAISNLVLNDIRGFTETLQRQVTGDNVADFIIEVCTAYGIGWDIYIENGLFVFDLYKGVDRSYNQNENSYVIFSDEYDNLLTSDYTYDKTNYKNVALVAGEGEGLQRKTAIAGEASDLDRYELYVDSRNSSTNEGEIDEATYLAMLTEEGNETLKEDSNSVTENIEGDIEVLGNYTFGKDYFLGDIVEAENEFGISAASRIIEIIESEDSNGSSTIPTFSTWEG